MISHGNIVANINKGRMRSGLGADTVSLHLLHRMIRVAQHLLQLGSTQQRKATVYLVKTPMSVLSGLGSCCFYPFVSPATCVIITDPSLEATLETIARFVSQQFENMSCYIYLIQVSSHSCPLPARLHTRTRKLPPHQGR